MLVSISVGKIRRSAQETGTMKLTPALNRVLAYCKSFPETPSHLIAQALYPTQKGAETRVSNMLCRLEAMGLIDCNNKANRILRKFSDFSTIPS